MKYGPLGWLIDVAMVRSDPAVYPTAPLRAIRSAPRHWAADDPRVGPMLWNLAHARIRLGRPLEAVPLLERELQMLERTKGPDDEETQASRENLAQLRQALNDHGLTPGEA